MHASKNKILQYNIYGILVNVKLYPVSIFLQFIMKIGYPLAIMVIRTFLSLTMSGKAWKFYL